MHVEAGHYNNMPEDLAKDLRCPLCLYHTKRKSNMIDHIVLHRGTLPSKWNRPHSMFFCFFTSQLYWWVMLWETGFQCCGSGGRINLRVKGSVRVNIGFFFFSSTYHLGVKPATKGKACVVVRSEDLCCRRCGQFGECLLALELFFSSCSFCVVNRHEPSEISIILYNCRQDRKTVHFLKCQNIPFTANAIRFKVGVILPVLAFAVFNMRETVK